LWKNMKMIATGTGGGENCLYVKRK
jgi:hypothetical protein